MTRRYHLHTLFLASLVLLDIGGLILAFQGAYWARFFWPSFMAIFPPWKGIPEFHLYQQTLAALLPMCLIVFAFMGFYRDTLLSAYDEFVLVLRGMLMCTLLTTAMTFAYRAAEY